jgi:hypothetical protein
MISGVRSGNDLLTTETILDPFSFLTDITVSVQLKQAGCCVHHTRGCMTAYAYRVSHLYRRIPARPDGWFVTGDQKPNDEYMDSHECH